MPPTPQPINNVWSTTRPLNAPEYLTLPSGQTCTARRIGIEGLISAGVLHEADSLTALVQDGPIKQGKSRLQGRKPKKSNVDSEEQATLRKVMENPEALAAIITMADKTMPEIVVTPVVKLHYVGTGDKQRMLSADERRPGIVYTDQIPFQDKMWLFQWAVGDLGAVAAFRDGSNSTVDDVDAESDVSVQAE